jgi:peptidyl-prolyl cis-trans isomerase SurA
MKKALIVFFVILSFASIKICQAQTGIDPILMTVAGENVTKSEFLNVYLKNNIKGDAMDRKSLEEYLDLYTNFKLKVKEAEEMGLDTAKSFINELAGYRKQLTQPYLNDKSVEDVLLQEAWERSKYDLRASHILIKLDKNATPSDTLAAYKKIMAIRNRIVKGEAFDKVAREVSEDDQSRDRVDPVTKKTINGNGGDLGYFTVLDMIYPFETGAFNTALGQVSMPIRTDNGYHLIKITEKIPALGKITVAHLFISVPKDAKPEDLQGYKDKIDEAYKVLQGGEKWEDAVSKYSDDKGSAAKGGMLPSFGVNQIVPEFIEAITKLKNNGDFSEPVKTIYGWHIVKLVDKKGPSTFEEDKAALKNRLIRDKRMNKSKEAVINRVKKEYGFQEMPGVVADFYSVVDTNIFNGTWDVKKAVGLNKTMFLLDKKVYNENDFSNYLLTHQSKKAKSDISPYINEKYGQFVEESVLNYEDGKLEEKYPEFKALMKEYRDGILLFELTDQKVWSKAIKDTTGLQAFYEQNKNNYLWDERLDASIFKCKDETTAKAARKLVKVQEKKGYTDQDIMNKINTDSIPVLTITNKLYLHKENSMIDNVPWQKTVTDNMNIDSSIVFVVVHKLVPPTPKTIKEAKGIITADYQNYLEKQWVDDLRKKYPVTVNKNVFESIIKN